MAREDGMGGNILRGGPLVAPKERLPEIPPEILQAMARIAANNPKMSEDEVYRAAVWSVTGERGDPIPYNVSNTAPNPKSSPLREFENRRLKQILRGQYDPEGTGKNFKIIKQNALNLLSSPDIQSNRDGEYNAESILANLPVSLRQDPDILALLASIPPAAGAVPNNSEKLKMMKEMHNSMPLQEAPIREEKVVDLYRDAPLSDPRSRVYSIDPRTKEKRPVLNRGLPRVYAGQPEPRPQKQMTWAEFFGKG